MTDSTDAPCNDGKEIRHNPNDYGVAYEDIEVGDRVRLYSSHTESEATGTVREKKLQESIATEGAYYPKFIVDIDPSEHHSGTVAAEEWAELSQIREVLGDR